MMCMPYHLFFPVRCKLERGAALGATNRNRHSTRWNSMDKQPTGNEHVINGLLDDLREARDHLGELRRLATELLDVLPADSEDHSGGLAN